MNHVDQLREISLLKGWTFWPIVGWVPPGINPPFTLNAYPKMPFWTTDISAAYELLVDLTILDVEIVIENIKSDHWLVEIANPVGSVCGRDPLLATAICEAYLKFKGKWKETMP